MLIRVKDVEAFRHEEKDFNHDRPPGAGLSGLAMGCGSGKPTLDPVHGKVYYNGAFTCGTIVFTPDASRGNGGSLARSEIQSDGSFSLRTEGNYGALPGWYRVTVMAVETPSQPEAGQRYAFPRSLLPKNTAIPSWPA